MAPSVSEPAAADRSARIERTVAREMAHRQRLLRLYLLLLVVPLGVAAWFVVAGRSDRQLVQQEVAARVAPVEASYRTIAPKLEQVAELDRVLPVVTGAAEKIDAQRAEVAELGRSQQALAGRVESLSATLGSTDPGSRGEIKSLSDQVTGLQQTVERFARSTPDLGDLRERLDRQDRQLSEIAGEQKSLRGTLQDLRVRFERQPGAAVAPSADFEKFDARLRALETNTEVLRGDLGKLDTRIRTQRPPG
jgi:chromosome segregation ATPase